MFHSRSKIMLTLVIFCSCWPLVRTALRPLATEDLSAVDKSVLEFVTAKISAIAIDESQSHFSIKFYSLDNVIMQRLGNLVNAVLKRNSNITIHVGTDYRLPVGVTLGLQLIFVDNRLSLRSYNDAAKSDHVKMNFKRNLILLLPAQPTDVPPFADMQLIFIFVHKRHKVNTLVAFAASNGEIQIYTYFPYLANDCGSTQPHLLHTYRTNASLPPMSTLYPTKNQNMNGCHLHVITAHVPPYVILHPTKTGLEALSGMEGLIIKEIAHKMNFSVNIWNTGEQIGGMVLLNGSAYGIYNMLQERRADLAIGDCGCYPLRMQLLSATIPYHQSYMRIVAKHGPYYSSFEVLFYPFKPDIRVVTIVIVALRCCIKLLGARLRMCPRQFRRFMLAMWLLIFFFYRCGYESFYFSHLRHPPQRPWPNTVAEFNESGYVIVADNVSATFLQWSTRLREMFTQLPIPPWDTFHMLQNNSGYKWGALAKPEHWAYMLQLARNHRIHLRVYVANENVVNEMMCTYFQRHSSFVQPFNVILRRMQSAGLIIKFLRDFVDLNAFERLRDTYGQRVSSEFPVTELRAIGLSHVKGAFWFLGLGWTIGVALFALEYLALKLHWVKMMLEILH